MRLPSVPGPRDVLDAVSRTGDAVDTLLGAVPRLVGVLGEAEQLVADARGLVGRIENTRAEAQKVIRRTSRTIDAAEVVLARAVTTVDVAEGLVVRAAASVDAADVVLARSVGTVDGADRLLVRTGATVDAAEPLVARVGALTDRLEPPLVALQPTLERLAETTDPREVDALVTLIDTTPALVEQLQQDVLPILTTLGSVAPDIHDLLDVSRELNLMLARLPGMGRIKRRVDEQQEEDED